MENEEAVEGSWALGISMTGIKRSLDAILVQSFTQDGSNSSSSRGLQQDQQQQEFQLPEIITS